MDFTAITVEILKTLSHIPGGYGLAIILLTVIVRLAMWPLGDSQQRSMRKMQILSPKLKEIQNRYKNDPQVMQKKMMEFYKENKFNPFGGCLPLLIQMPIFILLYTALISPQFIYTSANAPFLFIDKLYSSIQSHAGVIGDDKFGLKRDDKFSINKKITIYTKNNGVIDNVDVAQTAGESPKQNDIEFGLKLDRNRYPQGSIKLEPGKPLTFKLNLNQLNCTYDELNNISKAEALVTNNNTREVENLSFKKDGSFLIATAKTTPSTTVFNIDVIILVVLFGITMFLSQKYMSNMNSAAADPAQKAMQDQMTKMMPVMITLTFIFVPIPAGVLLYMVVSNVIQVIQTVMINKKIDAEEAAQKVINNVDIKTMQNAKNITPVKEEK